ncbi:MAG: HDOD domain-containing protein [Planctomycetaceae bacterium]
MVDTTGNLANRSDESLGRNRLDTQVGGVVFDESLSPLDRDASPPGLRRLTAMPISVADDEITIPDEILRQLKRKSASLNMLPAVAMQALELSKNPDCSITEFARVVERDVKLATDILSMANSSIYSGALSVSSLHQAVVRLGLRQCKNLIYCSSLTSLMQKMSTEDAAHREQLWRHSFHTAVLALHFNHSCGIGFQGEEFTAGLMHDIGRTLLGVCLPERSLELDLLDYDGSPRLLVQERMLSGTDHCELGAYFAEQNRLPPPLIESVRFHHEPTQSRLNLRLVSLTAACDHMASYLQRHGGPDGYDPAENSALLLLEDAGVPAVAKRFSSMHTVLMRNAQHDAEQMMRA